MANPLATLPCSEITIRIDVSPDAPLDLSALPAKPGVFILEDAKRRTLALTTTANLRRMVKSKLEPPPPPETAGPSRRIDYRSLTRRILALEVGSAFEADWAYLQLARQRLPAYRGLLDRWQAWFIECDPSAAFPQFTKTAHPKNAPDTSMYLGPFPDKHAAGRYMEMLVDAFDLCRYHHLLVQAPHAMACAYKEMGRCPAPCDGSISLDEYRRRVGEAIDFACTPIDRWRSETELAMQRAGANLQFEEAQRLRLLLERTALATRAESTHVDRLERFIFVAVMAGEPGRSRLGRGAKIFLIRGGWIEPVADLSIQADAGDLDRKMAAIRARAKPQAADFSVAGIENIGMACWHLFHRRATKTKGVFLRLNDELNSTDIAKALRQLERRDEEPVESEDSSIAERDLDNLAADQNPA